MVHSLGSNRIESLRGRLAQLGERSVRKSLYGLPDRVIQLDFTPIRSVGFERDRLGRPGSHANSRSTQRPAKI